MKKKIIRLIEKRITRLYSESRTLLLNKKSYTAKEVDTQSIAFYIAFLESSLKKPYNRLNSLTLFLNEDGALMTSQMYPLGLLKDKVKKLIQDNNRQAAKFAEGLDISQIDPNYVALSVEEHLKVKS